MTFREYIHLLAESIGLHQIPVVLHATDIQHFLAEDAVHHQFVTGLVRTIYKKNHCGHLDATINTAKTLSLLELSRSALLAGNEADICRVRLMNQICDQSKIFLSREVRHLTQGKVRTKRLEITGL